MFEGLKKAWHAVRAWGAGVSAYVTTLFNTEGTFAEANRAASAAYDRAYDRSMGVDDPSLRGVGQQLGRGDFEGALKTAGRGLEDVATRAANAVLGGNQAREEKPRVVESKNKMKQAQRGAARAEDRNAVRDKYGLKGHQNVAPDVLNKAQEQTAHQQGFWQKLTGARKEAKGQEPAGRA